MAKLFSTTESEITKSFEIGETFRYDGLEYYILDSGKPSPKKGECKTDTYILGETNNENLKAFKISIKQKNADFLENKINLERSLQILGPEAQKIISKATNSIKSCFEEDYLVTFDKVKKTEAKTMKIGWKFELLNKKGGDKSGQIQLSNEQLIDVYSGVNLDDDKKNSMVNGVPTKSSGIANYIFFAEEDVNYTVQEVIDKMELIENYIKNKKVFFACKAINFRVTKDKWDGNRPLSVYVDWNIQEGQLFSKLIFDNPLEVKANIIGEKIRKLLNSLNIDAENFSELKSILMNTKSYTNDK